MSRLRASALICILVLCVCSHVHTAVNPNLVDPDLVVRNVERHIDLQSQLTKITTRVVLDNNSKDRSTQNFLFCLDGAQKSALSYIAARVEPGKLELKVAETKVGTHSDKAFFSIDLANHLPPRRTLTIEIETILTHELVPHPKKITQQEKQLVKYTGKDRSDAVWWQFIW